MNIDDAKRDRHGAAEASLAKANDLDLALRLRELMRRISEEHSCAGWWIGLEEILWRLVEGGAAKGVFGGVTNDEIEELRRLNRKSGGWWRWTDESGEVFVTTEEWAARSRSM